MGCWKHKQGLKKARWHDFDRGSQYQGGRGIVRLAGSGSKRGPCGGEGMSGGEGGHVQCGGRPGGGTGPGGRTGLGEGVSDLGRGQAWGGAGDWGGHAQGGGHPQGPALRPPCTSGATAALSLFTCLELGTVVPVHRIFRKIK